MGFKSIEINNFRGIRKLQFGGLKRINILMGNNNVGKSSVLEACFLLAGISNPYLGFTINQYRGFSWSYFKGLESLFYNLDFKSKINLSSIDYYGIKRETTIEPVYGYLDMLNSKNVVSSSNNQQVIGLSSEFIVDNEKYLSTVRGIQTSNSTIDISSSTPKEYQEVLTCNLIKNDESTRKINRSLEAIILEKKIGAIISILQKIEPSLVDITIVNDEIVVDIGLSKYLPINILGDGFKKVLTFITFLYECKDGVLLIDELDNGLHYSTWSTVWQSLFELTKELNVQLITTTHSLEFITSLEHFLYRSDDKSFQENVICFSLKKYSDEGMEAYRYDYENMKIAIEQELEMR